MRNGRRRGPGGGGQPWQHESLTVEVGSVRYDVVFTDGACTDNQDGRFRRAGYGVFWGFRHPGNVAAALEGDQQTNNAAELMAVIVAIERGPARVEVRTDSQYVYDGCLLHR
eukprot:gene17646-8820_t